MREIDTEAPVVWPAWCYSGDGAESESSTGALPPSLPAAPVRARGKRRNNNHHSHHNNHNHHQNNHHQINHPHHPATTSSAAAAVTPAAAATAAPPQATMNGADHQAHHIIHNNNNNNTTTTGLNNNNNSSSVNNNNSSVNNNHHGQALLHHQHNAVKTERLSPGRATLTPDNQSSASRSRSVTPSSSSYPGTPPQNAPDRGPSPAQAHATIQRHMEQVIGRNCSDFIRSLAAKYNNSNPNDYFGAARNGFPALDPRFGGSHFKGSPFPGLLAPLLPSAGTIPGPATVSPSTSASSQRGSPTQAAQSAATARTREPEAVSPKRTTDPPPSVYPGFPFPQGSMFQPLIDMSSTQALVQMMRAAKEDQMQSLMKNTTSASVSPSTSANLHSPPSLPAPALNSAPATAMKRSSSESSPLDLSSAAVAKKPKTHDRSPVAAATVAPAVSPVALPVSVATARCPGPPHCEGDSELAGWAVEDVCNFVAGIDICAEYSQNFRDQCIDGSALPLLTEEHLTGSLGMKLGPALKLRSLLARRMGPSCPGCGGRKSSQSAPQSPSGGNKENSATHRPLSRGSTAGNS